MNIKSLVEDEIVRELSGLETMEIGSDKYESAVNGVTKLVDRAIEMEKLKIECEEKMEDREFDNKLKLQQSEDEQKDRLLKNCIAVAGIVIPSVITIWGTMKTFKFEEEGTITTSMGRGFINKLIPKK